MFEPYQLQVLQWNCMGSFFRLNLVWIQFILPHCLWLWCIWTYAEAKVWRRPAPKLEKQAEDLTEFPQPVFLVVRQYIYLSLVINSLDVLTVHAVLLMLEENSLQSCRTLCMNACTSWPSILLSISYSPLSLLHTISWPVQSVETHASLARSVVKVKESPTMHAVQLVFDNLRNRFKCLISTAANAKAWMNWMNKQKDSANCARKISEFSWTRQCITDRIIILPGKCLPAKCSGLDYPHSWTSIFILYTS
jgi:hypothetical protein